ncbi:MAG: hypothetical protein KIS88_02720 [Anaerolineales bacterium]|nr:hypothetical protein [Anaerolineales bacterium]
MNIQQTASEVCIPNISTAERRKRLGFAVLAFGFGLAILAILVATGTDRLWRLPLLLLFWGAGSSFFQWLDKTCVGFAAQGVRKLGDTTEKIEDANELAQVRRQALRVQLKGLLVAVPLTLIALALPSLG